MLLLLMRDLFYFLEKKQSLRSYRVVTILEPLQKKPLILQKNMRNQEPFHVKSATGENFTKIGQTIFELGRIRNIGDFIKKLIRAATDLVESRLFEKQHIPFSDGWFGFFWSLYLHHEALNNSNFSSQFFRSHKLKKILPIGRLQDALSRKERQTHPGAQSTYFSRV